MARSSSRNTADATVGTVTYADGVGFDSGNRAPSSKYRTAEGEIVDDLKGEAGWTVVVKGDVVTPAVARMLDEGGPNLNAGAGDGDVDVVGVGDEQASPLAQGRRPRQSPEYVDAAQDTNPTATDES